ncbi:TPA: hypothetical protein ACY38A_000572 [Pasteurella multocida]|uniref:hypothetical protein n=1 Tax=Pasteurella multocida TaxID=747 RepID=UPI0038FD3CD7
MKKMFVILTTLLLAGCDRNFETVIEERCIDGVVYLVYQGWKQGGITPKINADFYPYTCVKKSSTDIPQ